LECKFVCLFKKNKNIIMKKVNFLIIGTQKAGTTSLFNYLKQHDDLYFSEVKEITYFVNDDLYKKGESYYHSFFNKFNGEKVIGSSDVHLLPSGNSPKRVKEYNPDMKFVVMVRNPVDRAFSAYKYAVKNNWEDSSNTFKKTFKLEKERKSLNNYNLMYFENGMYNKHLLKWTQFFDKKQFLIIEDKHLKENPESCLQQIFNFLALEDLSNKIDTSKQFNKAGIVKYKWLQSFILDKNSVLKTTVGKLLPAKLRVWIRSNIFQKLIRFNQKDQVNEKISEDFRKELNEYFAKSNFELEKSFNIIKS